MSYLLMRTILFRDCYTRTQTGFDDRLDICRISIVEELALDPNNPVWYFTFFQCLELLNSQPYIYQNVAAIPNPPQVFSYAKDFLQVTTEICIAGRFNYNTFSYLLKNCKFKPTSQTVHTLQHKEKAVT